MDYKGRYIPNKLRKERRLMMHSQKELAQLMGVDPADVSRWENGLAIPTTENLFKLASYFNKPPEYLFSEYYKYIRLQVEAVRKNLSEGKRVEKNQSNSKKEPNRYID